MIKKRVLICILSILATLALLFTGCSAADPLVDNLFVTDIWGDDATFNTITIGGVPFVAGNYVPYNGATGNIDLNAKEVINGTLNNMVGKGTWMASGTWKLPAMFFNGDITTDRWLSTSGNTFLGVDVIGNDNLAHTVGSEGYYNTGIGYRTLYNITTSYFNTAVGAYALEDLTTGTYNTAVGQLALGDVVTGNFNTAIGMQALAVNIGSYNTAIGLFAGASNIVGDSNIFIGASAGKSELGSNKLYIDVVDTLTPVIYGNFSSDYLTFYGELGIGVDAPSALIHLKAGTAVAGTAPLKLTAGTLLTTPEAGALEYDGMGIYLTNTNHRRFISQAADSIIASETVANTTVDTTVFTAMVNADELKAHRVYRMSFYGQFGTNSAADTVTVSIHVNGTVIGTITSTAGVVSGVPFRGEAVFTVRTTGVAGTISSYTELTLDTKILHTNTSSLVVNTTNINYATLHFQWDNADVDNTITLDQAFLEVLD